VDSLRARIAFDDVTPLIGRAAGDCVDPADLLRILYVSAEYLPHSGGTAVHTHEVGRRLVASGHLVTVLTTDRRGDLPPAEEIDGVAVRRVRAWPGSTDWYFAPRIYSAVRRASVDVVHCQGYHTLVAPLAMLAAQRARLPYVLTFHSGGHSSPLRNRLRPLQWRALRPLFARAERLIGVSGFEADLVRTSLDLPCDLFTVVPNGADLFDVATNGEVAQDPNLLVSMGRLERYKGHHRVLEALPAVLAKRSEARLLVLGSGPYEDELRAIARRLRIDERVSFRAIPASARAEMARVLESAGVVIAMSEYESQGIGVLEALHLGRPVVLADATGLHELVEKGLACGVGADADPSELADAILRQLEDARAPQVIDLPTWEDCCNRLLEIYRRTLARAVESPQ
jgi:glycosyltransferase involved in cell wall biosynthesis